MKEWRGKRGVSICSEHFVSNSQKHIFNQTFSFILNSSYRNKMLVYKQFVISFLLFLFV